MAARDFPCFANGSSTLHSSSEEAHVNHFHNEICLSTNDVMTETSVSLACLASRKKDDLCKMAIAESFGEKDWGDDLPSQALVGISVK
jgi:hypothetical protein